jgi:hypothetical protein
LDSGFDPVQSGMMTSLRTMSGRTVRASSIAEAPVETDVASNPASFKISTTVL